MKGTLYARHVLFFVLLLSSGNYLSAQDIHFSQFGNSPLNLNPGLNGVFGGDIRFVGNYRSQWRGVPVPYSTFSGSIENKIYHKPNRYDRYFTGGLLLHYDRQGTLELTSLQIGIPIGLTMPLAKNQFLSLGVTPAFGQRSFDTDHWTFDAQFVDCLFDPTASTRESGSLFSDNLQYFDLNAGLNYRFHAKKTRTRFDIGGAIHHINRPNHDFWTNAKDVRLAARKAVYGTGLAQVSDKFDLLGQVLYQEQGAYRELLYGIGGRLLLNDRPYNELALQVGVSFRHRYTDAFIWNMEVHWRTWTLGFSYDLNLSDFVVATDNRGGPEVSLIYRLYKIKPVVKQCPID
ncbi:MAG: PorP/SprF family type IX secretion system membrane protein [Lewinellaceae bacterium]|nr:PorP/SprF family type IX secretion system membrane protein [Lewinellaceae bacterium]